MAESTSAATLPEFCDCDSLANSSYTTNMSNTQTRNLGVVADFELDRALTVSESMLVSDVSQLCTYKHVNSVLVVDDEEGLSGIFTPADIAFRVIAKGLNSRTTPVSKIMTRCPIVIHETASVAEALQVMIQHGFRELPVCNEEGDVVGLLDITKVFQKAIGKLYSGYSTTRPHNAPQNLCENSLSTVMGLRTRPMVINLDATVREAVKVMEENQAMAVCVTQSSQQDGSTQVAGILTCRDILQVVAAGLHPDECSVGRVMTHHPNLAGPDVTVYDALKMIRGVFKKLITVANLLQVMYVGLWQEFKFRSTLKGIPTSRYPVVATKMCQLLEKRGFSDVYRGRLISNTQVAIKALRLTPSSAAEHPSHLKPTRELHTWSKCSHPNVLQLLGLVVFRGRIGMVSPWMGNGTLPRYLERTPGVNRCNLCVQICEGLTYLHQNGIIHGDLKGANVLISDKGIPALTDFGNSLHTNQSLRFTKTKTGKSLTVQWSAPELIMDSGEPSEAADVYALAMTIYEAMAGAPPYNGKREHTIIYLLVNKKEAPQRPECIPIGSVGGDKLWGLLTRCWAFEPELRPSASEVANIMKAITPDSLVPIAVSVLNPEPK
ncbi:unnamed protein product [Rhizoctonia solani]|uniref:Uncharacterized protein n=1 Tax=Rhizoctonia solani TaxID=456999 RepID=A0A8H3GTY5_9AGAM|nr:unnamed protein product [Rhizoctonia solani]